MAIKSCVSYPGAKWKAMPQILELIPEGIKDWREPFFGGGSVTLGFLQDEKSKDCERFVVGDIAPEMYSLWKGIQDDHKKVIDIATDMWNTKVPTHNAIHNTPLLFEKVIKEISILRGKAEEFVVSDPYILEVWLQAEKEGMEFWNWASKVDTCKMSLHERAARMFLVNRVSFSGMGDSGSLSKDQLLDFKLAHLNKIAEVAPLLQRIEIYMQGFQDTMKDCSIDNGFIFLDPPYLRQEKSALYGRGGDTHKGFPHKEFAEHCKQTKTPWLVTYDDSVAVRKLFRGKDIYIKPFTITYTMAGKTSEDALAGEELFIANYDINKEEGNSDVLDLL